jgi:hypothetical protein
VQVSSSLSEPSRPMKEWETSVEEDRRTDPSPTWPRTAAVSPIECKSSLVSWTSAGSFEIGTQTSVDHDLAFGFKLMIDQCATFRARQI